MQLPANEGYTWRDYMQYSPFDFSAWLETFRKGPLPDQGPMKRGSPQEPAGNKGGTLKKPSDIAEDIGHQIEGAVNRILGGIFSPQHVRDGAIYGGAALLILVALYATIK